MAVKVGMRWSFLVFFAGLKVPPYFRLLKSCGTARRRAKESWLRDAFLNFVTGNSRWTAVAGSSLSRPSK